MIRIQTDTIQSRELRDFVAHAKAGAVLIFEGTTRDNFEGKDVVELRYETYKEMAISTLKKLRDELIAGHPDVRVAIAHRVGVVPVQESSVVIAVSAPHRDLAYRVSRDAIDRLKREIPIWKKEIYADGGIWKENR